MSRGSFSRSVARAASSGGGKAYRTRSPVGWYLVMAMIAVLGISLVVYSRYENQHLKKAPATTVLGPTASQHWQAAYAFDICGTMEPALPVNSNLATVGIRTFGNGLIDINPGALTTGAAKFEGAKATLGLFASSYPNLKLTATSVQLPGTKSTNWYNGVDCTGKTKGVGKLQVKVWSSPTATGKILTTDPTKYHLTNGSMITIAFVPVGTPIPVPSSKAALISSLGSKK